MRLRVVCGLGEMIASFSPTSALSRVDLPALGRPRMQTKPERKGIGGCELRVVSDELLLVARGPRLTAVISVSAAAVARPSRGRVRLCGRWTPGLQSADRLL